MILHQPSSSYDWNLNKRQEGSFATSYSLENIHSRTCHSSKVATIISRMDRNKRMLVRRVQSRLKIDCWFSGQINLVRLIDITPYFSSLSLQVIFSAEVTQIPSFRWSVQWLTLEQHTFPQVRHLKKSSMAVKKHSACNVFDDVPLSPGPILLLFFKWLLCTHVTKYQDHQQTFIAG